MTQVAPTIRRAAVYTHNRPHEVEEGIHVLAAAARRLGVELVFESDEPAAQADVCIVLGGDGATLRALRHHAGTDVPVFAVNYGRIGFLATVDRDDLPRGLELALTGQFEVVRLPALLTDGHSTERFAINEVSFQRPPHMN